MRVCVCVWWFQMCIFVIKFGGQNKHNNKHRLHNMKLHLFFVYVCVCVAKKDKKSLIFLYSLRLRTNIAKKACILCVAYTITLNERKTFILLNWQVCMNKFTLNNYANDPFTDNTSCRNCTQRLKVLPSFSSILFVYRDCVVFSSGTCPCPTIAAQFKYSISNRPICIKQTIFTKSMAGKRK